MKELQLNFLNPPKAVKDKYHPDFWPENRIPFLKNTRKLLWELTKKADELFVGGEKDATLIININVGKNALDNTDGGHLLSQPNSEYKAWTEHEIRFQNKIELKGTTSLSSSIDQLSFMHLHEITHNYFDFDSTPPVKNPSPLLKLFYDYSELLADHTPAIVLGSAVVCGFLENHFPQSLSNAQWHKDTHPTIETRVKAAQNHAVGKLFTKAIEAAKEGQKEGKPHNSWQHFIENQKEIASVLKKI